MKEILTSITTSQEGHTLRLIPISPFDLTLGYQMWQLCALEERIFHRYIFDFERLHELRDSGLAWLIMFSRRAVRANRKVKLANCSRAVWERCLGAGFSVNEQTDLLEFRETEAEQTSHITKITERRDQHANINL